MVPEIKSTQTHSLAIHIYNFKQGEMLSAWIRKEMVAVFCVSRPRELKKGEVPENQTSRVNTIFFFFSILSCFSFILLPNREHSYLSPLYSKTHIVHILIKRTEKMRHQYFY